MRALTSAECNHTYNVSRKYLAAWRTYGAEKFNIALFLLLDYLTLANEYEVLRPPAEALTSTFFRMRSSMSRRAVSCEHLVSLAHLDDFSLPSNPLSRRLTISRCRSLNSTLAKRSQKRALLRTVARIVSARSNARPRHSRNHSSQRVMSSSPFCVASRIS